MTKKTIVTTTAGKFAFLFLIISIVGLVFQFIYFYLPLIEIAGGDGALTADFIFGMLALAFGALAFILSIFVIPKNLWIGLVFSVIVFTLIPPIIYDIAFGNFPYVFLYFTQFSMLTVVPTNPMLDFVGFWMAGGGSLIALIIGFTLPKK